MRYLGVHILRNKESLVGKKTVDWFGFLMSQTIVKLFMKTGMEGKETWKVRKSLGI